MWHVHGSWATAFVGGPWETVLPLQVGPDGRRTPDGLGRATTWDWPSRAREVPLGHLREERLDAVVLQRPHEEELLHRLTGLKAGVDVPAVYVEHNTPKGDVPLTRHPVADRGDLLLVHVTRTNALLWDSGSTRTAVVEHGVPRPDPRWSGEVARAAVVLNEPVRRWRVTGTDLLPEVAAAVPLDVYGMRVSALPDALPAPARARVEVHEDLPQHRMHREVARRACYVHPLRWTSLGLSLLEAMAMGVPSVVLAMTGAHEAVAPGSALLAWSGADLAEGASRLARDRALAEDVGAAGAARARARYGVERFRRDWEELLREITGAELTDAVPSGTASTHGAAAAPAGVEEGVR